MIRRLKINKPFLIYSPFIDLSMIALYNNRCKIPVKKREKKLRLLVVEDEKKLCDMIAKSLHQLLKFIAPLV